jgi:hypothetical protein
MTEQRSVVRIKPDGGYPTGVCTMAWQVGLGSSRHYCDYAAVIQVVINGHPYMCCQLCLDELIEMGYLPADTKAA